MTKIFGQEDDIVEDIAAVQVEVDNLDGDAMRGTDLALLAANYVTERGTNSAALASVWTSTLATALANYTAQRAGYLDQLDFALQEAIAAIPTTAMRGTDDALLAANYVTERGTDNAALAANDGGFIIGRAVTATLRVSPDGDNSDGLTWSTAYQTINEALDAASTDVNDGTLILISPHATYYDINTTGDPTWSANVILKGIHRNWAEIRNTHASATSIMKLTGKAVICDLSFDLGSDSTNGAIITSDGFCVDNVVFEGGNLTGAATALWIDGNTARFGKIYNSALNGHQSYMTGILLDDASENEIVDCHIHNCLTGLQIVNSSSTSNFFYLLDICQSTLGLDIDAGSEQRIRDVRFFNCTTNVDDEVGDHTWVNIFGEFNIAAEPDDLTGISVLTHADANTWGTDTEIRAAASSTTPFRVVGYIVEPETAEWYSVRFSSDSGSTFYDILLFDGVKKTGAAAPSGTEHIFNKGTRISASAKSETGAGDEVKVWLKIQEI